ncbi:adenosylcobinamide-GDP ribazoletransferase [Agathobaculum sp.]|uniref:adenosylcobinamide-GDP ribazoletransferase n=1 Tax=Agathobaculum sp. TaxID=2048138 RepID=UPI002A80F526|nr:adenosylcobinamide-GDP ribazoletransferase [Agathobaculum sp.]MDY3619029.1 adenosylcobinamide-GDP ribazoletransferase [Agathobaculum sp.]
MKTLWSGLCVAVSLYSKLPAPKTEWDDRTMRYALGFLPLIGAAIGALSWGWLVLARRLTLVPALYGAVAVLLPILVSGGIHLDGFLDTCDARCSYADREKRLKILEDPHVGAFAVVHLVGLLVLCFGLFCQLYQAPRAVLPLALGYPLARTIGGLAIVTIPCAKESGLARTFADASDRRGVAAVLLMQAALCLLLILWWDWRFGMVSAILGGGLLWWHRRLCLRDFGGVTGDLAGYVITLGETLMLALCVLYGLIVR